MQRHYSARADADSADLMTYAGRETELRVLRALSERAPVLAPLSGRRALGKTFLLDHAWRNRRHSYILASDTTSKRSRAELLRKGGQEPEREFGCGPIESTRPVHIGGGTRRARRLAAGVAKPE